MGKIKQMFKVVDGEWRSVSYSFLYFFCLMCGYFVLRPVRDEMGIQAGVGNLQWLFIGTFIVTLLVVPLFGLLLKKFSRKKLIPAVYLFFSLNIILFYAAFKLLDTFLVSSIFFIWLGVFNLFVISVFWSFSSDIFNTEQAKRLYGPIAAGGSFGAVLGPAFTSFLVRKIGVDSLLLVSSALILAATWFICQLIKHNQFDNQRNLSPSAEDNIWSGLRMIVKSPLLRQVGVFVLLYTTISTFLYFQQAHIVSQSYSSPVDRTFYFSARDLTANLLTLLIQFFLTEKIIRKWGIAFCLMLVPAVAVIGFIGLGLSQSIFLLFSVHVVYRSLSSAIQRPAREVLFTSVRVNEKYRSKNFIDTTLYRGGDAVGSLLFAGLTTVVSSFKVVALIAVPITVGWAISGQSIGKIFSQKTIKFNHDIEESNLTKKSA